jgi:hypothetical protein
MLSKRDASQLSYVMKSLFGIDFRATSKAVEGPFIQNIFFCSLWVQKTKNQEQNRKYQKPNRKYRNIGADVNHGKDDDIGAKEGASVEVWCYYHRPVAEHSPGHDPRRDTMVG